MEALLTEAMQQVLLEVGTRFQVSRAARGRGVPIGQHRSIRRRARRSTERAQTFDMTLLRREKDILQTLQHEHIVPCLDAGHDGRYYYLVMPYLPGGTLEDMLNESLLTLEETRAVLEQLTGALAYIHALGLLHRDIKPTNILFDRDYHLYLSDFGIASWLGENPVHNGHVMGTPHYTAPELFDGYVDERSEVYSVGILLYQLLTGTLPFDGPNDWKICLHHRETQPLAPSLLNPSLPRSVERVILGALKKDPCRRYQTAEDLLRAFQRALDAPTFFEQISSGWQATCQKLRDCLSPETPASRPDYALVTPVRMRGSPE
ncbi:MAG TPA: serine/threonine-protein kinase [Ktedonobacteraceae bacterium]